MVMPVERAILVEQGAEYATAATWGGLQRILWGVNPTLGFLTTAAGAVAGALGAGVSRGPLQGIARGFASSSFGLGGWILADAFIINNEEGSVPAVVERRHPSAELAAMNSRMLPAGRGSDVASRVRQAAAQRGVSI